jgi:quercetin dioxygenase-like cupin family protein
MNQKPNHRFILALGIALSLIACNGGEKKEEPAATTDSTSKAATDTVKAVVKEPATDAVTVAPDLYKLLADSLGISIIEATYKPGDSSVMHSHRDYAIYAIGGGTAAFYTKEGTRMVNEMKTGMINIRPEEFHSVKNIGKTTMHVLLVEVNRPKGTISQDASLDATKAAAAHYKLMRDTLGIRVIVATYKPGESSNLHAHPDAGVYAISGGTAEFTTKDGAKRTNEMKTGMAMISGAGTHSVKNTGKTTMKVLLVEVGRPQK